MYVYISVIATVLNILQETGPGKVQEKNGTRQGNFIQNEPNGHTRT
jgi:hypothetical protein